MPLIVKKLGYTLSPGERFTSDLGDSEETDENVKKYTKSEINRSEDILIKLKEMESTHLKFLEKEGDKPRLKSHPKKSENRSAKKFIEDLSVVGDKHCDENVDPKELESHFNQLASTLVKDGLTKLTDLKIPFNRPTDYYAEMVKSDEQMAKVARSLERKATNKKKGSSIGKSPKDPKGDKKAKKAKLGKKISKRQFQLQQKNKFIKSVNALRKKRKSGDIDKHLDRLMSSKPSSRRSPRTSSGGKASEKGGRRVPGKTLRRHPKEKVSKRPKVRSEKGARSEKVPKGKSKKGSGRDRK